MHKTLLAFLFDGATLTFDCDPSNSASEGSRGTLPLKILSRCGGVIHACNCAVNLLTQADKAKLQVVQQEPSSIET